MIDEYLSADVGLKRTSRARTAYAHAATFFISHSEPMRCRPQPCWTFHQRALVQCSGAESELGLEVAEQRALRIRNRESRGRGLADDLRGAMRCRASAPNARSPDAVSCSRFVMLAADASCRRWWSSGP